MISFKIKRKAMKVSSDSSYRQFKADKGTSLKSSDLHEGDLEESLGRGNNLGS